MSTFLSLFLPSLLDGAAQTFFQREPQGAASVPPAVLPQEDVLLDLRSLQDAHWCGTLTPAQNVVRVLYATGGDQGNPWDYGESVALTGLKVLEHRLLTPEDDEMYGAFPHGCPTKTALLQRALPDKRCLQFSATASYRPYRAEGRSVVVSLQAEPLPPQL